MCQTLVSSSRVPTGMCFAASPCNGVAQSTRRDVARGLMGIIARLLFVPTMLWNIVTVRWLGWGHWWDAADQHVWVGAIPLRRDVARLRDAGVRGVVNLCAECQGPVKEYREAGIEQLRIPLVDYTSPPLADVTRCLEFIDSHVSRGETVYVHCKAGRGRSATVVLCWLVSRGCSPDDAESLLRSKRPQILRHLSRRRVAQELWQQQQAGVPPQQQR